MHAFKYFGGRPQIIVYDQERCKNVSILSSSIQCVLVYLSIIVIEYIKFRKRISAGNVLGKAGVVSVKWVVIKNTFDKT